MQPPPRRERIERASKERGGSSREETCFRHRDRAFDNLLDITVKDVNIEFLDIHNIITDPNLHCKPCLNGKETFCKQQKISLKHYNNNSTIYIYTYMYVYACLHIEIIGRSWNWFFNFECLIIIFLVRFCFFINCVNFGGSCEIFSHFI